MKKHAMRALALVMAVLLCAASLVGCAAMNNPLLYLKRNLTEGIGKSLGGELISFLFTALGNGCLELDFDGTDLTGGLPEAAELKLWTNTAEHSIAAAGSVTLGGTVYDGSAWVNDDGLVMTSAAFFGSNNLGLDFLTLKNDLKTSIFANNSGTAYARPQISEDTAATVIGVKDAVFTLLNSSEKLNALVDEAVEAFLSELGELAYNRRYKEDGRTYVSLSVNNDALSRALRATRARLVSDRAFCRDVRSLAATLDALYAARDGIATHEYTTKVEYFISSEADIDVLCLKLDTAAPFVFTLDAAVRTFGSALEDMKCTYTVDGVQRLDAHLYLAEEGGISTLDVTLDGVTRALTYQVTKDSFRSFCVALSYEKRNAEGVVLRTDASLEADRRTDTYVLTLTQGESVRSFVGQYGLSDKQFKLSVTSATVNGEPKQIALSLSVSKQAQIPDVAEHINLISINTTRFAPIDERIRSTKEQLLASYGALELTPHAALSHFLTVLDLEEEIPPPPVEEPEEP